MPTFKNLNELFKYINKNIKETLNDEVADSVRFEEQKQIEKVVYEPYQPNAYKRRRYSDDGLQDVDMMVAVVEQRGNEVILSVVNMAKGQDQEDLYIAPLIEYGDPSMSNVNHGQYGEYQYKYNRDRSSWRYLQSRPFTAETIAALKRSGVHIEAFKEGMMKRGIIVK